MSDPDDFRRSTGMRLREDSPVPYDDFYCAPRGTYGHPSIIIEREPAEGWLERAREALANPDRRFEMLARRIDQLFRWW